MKFRFKENRFCIELSLAMKNGFILRIPNGKKWVNPGKPSTSTANNFNTRKCFCTQKKIGSGYNQSTWLGAATATRIFFRHGPLRLPFVFVDGTRIGRAALRFLRRSRKLGVGLVCFKRRTFLFAWYHKLQERRSKCVKPIYKYFDFFFYFPIQN